MAQRRSAKSDSPTLPLPPPRSQISLDEFVEAATSAALRAAQAQRLTDPDPQPWARRPIWVGIILDPWALAAPPSKAGQGQTKE